MSDLERFSPSYIEDPSDPDYAEFQKEWSVQNPELAAFVGIAFWAVVGIVLWVAL